MDVQPKYKLEVVKDLADIARLIEAHPHLRDRVPKDLLDRLV